VSSLVAFAESIEQSKIGTAIAESRYWWPIFEGTHLLSLSISFGLIFVTDLRLLGLWLRRVPVTDVLHQLRPYVLGGFVLTFLSGGLVFWSEAATVVVSPLWTVKIVLILLGGLNALYFEFVIAKRPEVVDNCTPLPASVRYAGLASMTIWTVVIICGRLLAYLPR
jgi:uncharacterized protein DUF6644